MKKVASRSYQCHTMRRAAKAVANPDVSKNDFERIIKQMSKEESELLIADLGTGDAPDPRKFFHIAKHLAGLA